MTAIDALLEGLFDYAGLFPPAALDLRAAIEDYLQAARGKHAAALGRFVVDGARISEFRDASSDSVRDIPLSVVATPASDFDRLAELREQGLRIETIEIKTDQPTEIQRIMQNIGNVSVAYFEVPVIAYDPAMLDAIAAAGAHVKLRMGGLVAEAFPATAAVAEVLRVLAERHLSFKATAGLHHPIRSRHPFTILPGGPAGVMHGFVNLLCASAMICFGGDSKDAKLLLDEEDSRAWTVAADAIRWRSYCWTADQLRFVRKQLMTSIGSCSFKEPIEDLEALGWL